MFKKLLGFTLGIALLAPASPVYADATQSSIDVLKGISFEQSTTQTTEEPLGWGLDFLDRPSDQNPFDSSYTYDSTGSGVTIYIIDDAVNPAISELSNISVQLVDVTPDKGTVNENSNCGTSHGTEIASIIAGKNIGIAKNVNLISVKAASCAEAGTGQLNYVAEAIEWVLINHDTSKTAIVNMSFGGVAENQEQRNAFETVLNEMTSKNLIPVAAAGNESADTCNFYPAAATKSIAVAALAVTNLGTTPRDSRVITAASYSNDGSCVDLWAPGTLISSQGGPNNYSSGTSMSAPVVSAALARILEANSLTGFTTIKNHLLTNNTTELNFTTSRPTTKKTIKITPAQAAPPIVSPPTTQPPTNTPPINTPPSDSVATEIINKPVVVVSKGKEITSTHTIVISSPIISIEAINMPSGFIMYYDLSKKALYFQGKNSNVQKLDAELIVIGDDGTKYTQNIKFLIREVNGKRIIKTEKTGKNKFSLVISNPDIGKKITVVNYNSKGKQIFKKTYTVKTNELGQYVSLKNKNQLRIGLTLPTSTVRTDVWIGGKKVYSKRTKR
jgi:hypothetical protein